MADERFHIHAVGNIMVQTDRVAKEVWVSDSGGYMWQKMRGTETDPRAFLLLRTTQRRFDRCCHGAH